jgi:phenylacetate-coenzyme A ligase PaaK-like adenylate-forming protein
MLYKGIDIARCRLGDLPVVTKSAMMENYDLFVTDKRLKLREIQNWRKDETNDWKRYLGDFLPIYTSGSSGETAVIVYHFKALELVQANLFARSSLVNTKRSMYQFTKILAFSLLGKKPRMAAVVIPRGNIYPIFNFSSPLYRLLINLRIIRSDDPLHKVVGQLNKFQPDCLISNSFFIALLAQEQLGGRLNIQFNHPHSFVACGGEVLTEHTQRLASMAWNKKVRNIYGSTECYTMAASCRKFDKLHMMSDLCILEIVDRHYHPVPRGQYGEKLLLTNLFNFVQPIIRYEMDDVTGYANQSCECGNPLPTLLPVRGRTSDFVYFRKPGGEYEKFHPYYLFVPLFYLNDLRQYQIVQTSRNELTFYYVPQKDAAAIEKQVTQILKESLGKAGLDKHVNLKFKRVNSIDRDKRSGKYKMIKSLETPLNMDKIPETNICR